MRALIVLIAACGGSDEPKDPLAVLQDTKRAWTYDVVSGPSIEALAPVADAPQVRCKITKPESFQTKKPHTAIECNPTVEAAASPLNRVMFKRVQLLFDRDRVREVHDLGDGIKSALGFSFPRDLKTVMWKYDNEERGVKSHVEVRGELRDVLGKERTVWIATGTYSTEFDGERGGPTVGAAIFAPKLGPVLLCDHDNATKTYSCLRLAGLSEVKAIKPKLSPKLPSIPERNELVKMLTTMDHRGDNFHNMLAGKLVVREDLPVTPGAMASTIEIEGTAIRSRGETVGLDVLREHLVDTMAKMGDDKVNVLVDGATPWSHVREALAVAAATGFVQPQFIFARGPSVPPPPKHAWVEQVIAQGRLEGNVAGELGKMIKTILEDCEDLRAAFTVDMSRVDTAAQIVDALAKKIPASPCHYDIDALRAGLYAILGSPYPHSSLGVRIDPNGESIDVSDTTPWREAQAKLKPGMSLKL